MENTGINQLIPFMAEANPTAAGRAAGSSEKGSGSFLDILSRLTQKNGVSVEPASDEAETALFVDLDDVSSTVLDSDMKGLIDMIEAIMEEAVAGDNASGSVTGAEGDPTGLSSVQNETPEKDVENLLLGLLALFAAKKQAAANPTGTPVPDGTQTVSNLLQVAAPVEKTDGETEGVSESTASSEGDSVTQPATDDQTTLEMLALILFTSLQTLQQNQEQAASQAAGQGQSPVAAVTDVLASAGGGGNIAAPKLAVEGTPVETVTGKEPPVEDNLLTTDTPEKRLEGFLEEALGTVKENVEPEGETAAGAEIRLIPAPKENASSGKLTLTVSGAHGVFGQGGQQGQAGQATTEAVDATGAQGGAQEDANGSLTVTSMVEDFSSLLEGKGEDSRHGDAGDKGGGSEKGEFQFMAGSDASKVTGEVPKEKAASQAGAAGSVEKFQQVLDQFNTKASNHDLFVKLDIGNKESLLLGFKDMGQNVTVEVKASHQAIADLLQNQKDAIVKHLESKDVHASIQIDPDASATADQRDRRETRDMRQRSFTNQVMDDGGFGEYLEVFA